MGDYAIGRAYDGVSNLTELRAGDDSTVGYSYDPRDDLVGIALPDTSDGISFAYDAGSNRTSIQGPSSRTDFTFDDASRVSMVTNQTTGGADTLSYSYDAGGNIVGITDGAGAETRYAYDGLNRLRGWYDPAGDSTTTYSYDETGNLLEVIEGTTVTRSLSYNGANQITSLGYGYDENGNLAEDKDHRYLYDSENRLIEATDKETSATIAEYDYDFMGRRISSKDSSGTTFYHYDGWNVVAESDASGTITTRYYYDESEKIMAMEKDGQRYFYQFNAHGDVVSLTDSSGTIVNSYSYDPWGNHLGVSEQVEQPFRYAGYRFDGETGLYYLRARYYSAGDMRFLTRDPIAGDAEEPRAHNRYAYVMNSPVMYIGSGSLLHDCDGRRDVFAGL